MKPVLGMSNHRLRKVIDFYVLCSLLLSALSTAEGGAVVPPNESTAVHQPLNAPKSTHIVQQKDRVALVDDANLDEALDRRSDLDFNNVSIDQENSGVSLSAIPAQAVKSAEVLKAATPDLDADTRGAILRVQYKPSYEFNDRLLSGRLYTRYKALYNSFGLMGDLTWGGRLGDDAGFRTTTEYENIQRGSDGLNIDWAEPSANGTSPPYIKRVNFSNNLRDVQSVAFNGSADFRFDENKDIYFRLSSKHTRTDRIASNVNFDYGEDENFDRITSQIGKTSMGKILRLGSARQENEEDLSLTLGGRSGKGPVDFEWRSQYQSYSKELLFHKEARFTRTPASLGYIDAGAAFPRFQPPTDDHPTLYALSAYDFSTQDENSDAVIGAIDATWDRNFIKRGDYLKFGLKYSSNQLDVVSDLHSYEVVANQPILLSAFLADHVRDDFLGRGYAPGFAPDSVAVGAFLREHPEAIRRDDLASALRSYPGSFSAEEDIVAAYSMINWQGKNLRIVAGARYEHTKLASMGNEVITTGYDFEVHQRNAGNDYFHIFPGLHLQYELSPVIALFGSYTKTIQRPDYSETAPYRVIDIANQNISEGNPDLRPALYQNIDLAIDYEPSENLLISWEIFYRDITDPTFTQTTYLSSGVSQGFRLDQVLNGAPATWHGSKLVLQHDLGSLASVLEPWSWSFAYTYNKSEASYPQRFDETLPLTDRPTDQLDTVVTFRGGKAYIQIGVGYRSDMLFRVSDVGPEKDQFNANNLSLNLKAEHRFNPRLTAFLDWKNLLADFYSNVKEGTTKRAQFYQHDPWAVLAGMRFRL